MNKYYMDIILPWQKIMRITIVAYLLLISAITALQASPVKAQVLAKRISVNYKNISLHAVLNDLQEKTKTDFGFTKELGLDRINIKQAEFKNEALKDILRKLLKGRDISFKEKDGVILLFRYKAAQPGKVSGRVLDEKGEFLPGATIRIAETGQAIQANVDGSYQLSMAPGTYTVEVSFISYQKQKITGVLITEGKMTLLDIAMRPVSNALGEVVITSSYKKASVEGLYARQKNNAGITDGISAEQIARTPDKNIGETLKRVSGLSTVDNKYVVVRGLSERYNGAMLNGQLMPSTELNRKQFSFDIIPTNMVENVVVSKTITPDLSAEFGGGLVGVETKTIPTENFLTITAGESYNDKTTGKYFTGLKIESKEYFGSIPDSRKLLGRTDWKSSQQIIAAGAVSAKAIPNNWAMYRYSPPVSPNLQLAYGHVFTLKDDRRIGVIASAGYRNTWDTQDVRMSRDGYDADNLTDENFKGKRYDFNVNVNGLAGIGYADTRNKVSAQSLYFRTLDQLLILGTGINPKGNGGFYDLTTYSSLLQNQLKGEHRLGNKGIKINWAGSYLILDKQKPDNHVMNFGYFTNPDEYPFAENADFTVGQGQSNFSEGVLRSWSRISEKDLSWDAALSVPFLFDIGKLKINNTLKTGYAGWSKNRLFWVLNTSSSGFGANQPISERFDPVINPGGQINPSKFNDGYKGKASLQAGYLMLDTKIGDKLRLVWGLRAEYVNLNKVNQVLDTAFANINKGRPESDKFDYSDLLNREPNLNLFPSANMTYSLTPKMNLRLAYAKSIIRPDLRELSYFREYDFELGGSYTTALVRSTVIHNLDFRYEWYPNPGELISFSLFYKKLNYPMEIYKLGDNREYELRNNKLAKNTGIEVELRKSLAFTGFPVIKHLTLYGNFTALQAKVKPMDLNYNTFASNNPLKITPVETVGAEESRPQTGASNYMYNAGVYYDGPLSLSLSYNYVTNRMFRPNVAYAYSLFERPLESLDGQLAFRFLKKRAELKFNISNLLGSSSVVYTNRYDNNAEIAGGKVFPTTQQLLYQKGRDIIDFEAKPGRTLSLTASYQF